VEAALLAASSAQLAAEGMARTKSSFLANMSHEIRTPMNAVLGLSRMVLEGELPPKAHEQISKVHEAAMGLTRILDDVLDFSKIEAGALRFEHRPFALFKVLSGVKSLFRPMPSKSTWCSPWTCRWACPDAGGRRVPAVASAEQPGQQRAEVHVERRDSRERRAPGRAHAGARRRPV
jgi:signal transduction histidine kinase